MAIGHDPVVIANASHPAALLRAAVDRAEFTNQVAIANFQQSGFALILFILRVFAYGRKLENAVATANAGRPSYHNMWPNPAVIADFNIGAYDGVSPDRNIRS